jgi:hypothetical protein
MGSPLDFEAFGGLVEHGPRSLRSEPASRLSHRTGLVGGCHRFEIYRTTHGADFDSDQTFSPYF